MAGVCVGWVLCECCVRRMWKVSIGRQYRVKLLVVVDGYCVCLLMVNVFRASVRWEEEASTSYERQGAYKCDLRRADGSEYLQHLGCSASSH